MSEHANGSPLPHELTPVDESWQKRDLLLEEAPERAKAFEQLVERASPGLKAIVLKEPGEIVDTLIGAKPAVLLQDIPQSILDELIALAEHVQLPLAMVPLPPARPDLEAGGFVVFVPRLIEIIQAHPDQFPIAISDDVRSNSRDPQFLGDVRQLLAQRKTLRTGIALGYPRSAVEYLRNRRRAQPKDPVHLPEHTERWPVEQYQFGGLNFVGPPGSKYHHDPSIQRFLAIRERSNIEPVVARLRDRYHEEIAGWWLTRRQQLTDRRKHQSEEE